MINKSEIKQILIRRFGLLTEKKFPDRYIVSASIIPEKMLDEFIDMFYKKIYEDDQGKLF